MQHQRHPVVVLGTGGTIAGTAARADDNVGYRAAQLGVQALVAAVPALAGTALATEQVAQLDSKDMSVEVWQRLAQAVARHAARDDVAGIVVTHGTDTLEETAWFLHRVLPRSKPVVLTAAMRPASSLQADGPQNLLDAVTVARAPGAVGVVVVLAGRVHHPGDVRKRHGWRVDEAFDSGDAGPLALVEDGAVRPLRAWPDAPPHAAAAEALVREPGCWPRVEIVTSHAGADGRVVDLLAADGAHGLVVAGTGNGTVHVALEAALRRAAARGVAVRRASRCLSGVVGGQADDWPSAGALTPPKARVELLLDLLSTHGAISAVAGPAQTG